MDSRKKSEWKEWKDIGRKIENLIKNEIDQLAKSAEPQNWKETGKKLETVIKSKIANAVGTGTDAKWEDIGRNAENHVKDSIRKWAGASSDDDWSTVGKKVDEKIRSQAASFVGVEHESDWINIGKKLGDKIKTKLNEWLDEKVEPEKKEIDRLSEPYRNWYYYPDFIIQPSPRNELNFVSVDCPLVWKLGDKWQMWYTGFDGRGYQTALATSDDLVNWETQGIVMGFGKEGSFDYGGVTFGGALFESYNIRDPKILKKWNDKYWVLYGCYPKQGGYEIRPGTEGAAWSYDAVVWHRASEDIPILSINGADEWEKDCIYQPWLLEHNGRFWNFYNAAKGSIEQIGLATSTDMLTWYRYPGNPIVRNRPGGYDEQFCSDPKVFYDDDHWVMFYFGVGRGGAHIMIAFSNDLIKWKSNPEPLYKAGGHPNGLDKTYAHKISLVYNEKNETFYMFYCAVSEKGRGICLLTSKPI
ncbi:MAG: hypothetical protein ACUVWN_04170 [bacterium]